MMLLVACGYLDREVDELPWPDTGGPVDTVADVTDTADTADAAPIPAVDWTTEGLTLSIENGSIGGYWFGMISPTYTGEDCIDHNQEETTAGGHDKCHEANAGGEMWWTLVVVDEETAERYLHDRNDDFTLFDSTVADSLTYILMDKRSLACWVWGLNPAYYDALGLECSV